MILNFVVLFVSVAAVCSTQSVSFMSAVANVAVGAGVVLRYLPPYSVDEKVSGYVPCLDVRRCVMNPISQTLTVSLGDKKRETAYAR